MNCRSNLNLRKLKSEFKFSSYKVAFQAKPFYFMLEEGEWFTKNRKKDEKRIRSKKERKREFEGKKAHIFFFSSGPSSSFSRTNFPSE